MVQGKKITIEIITPDIGVAARAVQTIVDLVAAHPQVIMYISISKAEEI